MSAYIIDPAKLRRARGTRRKEAVAVYVGRSFTTITGYEAGTIRPSIETLLALVDLYGVTVEDLRGDAEEVVAS